MGQTALLVVTGDERVRAGSTVPEQGRERAEERRGDVTATGCVTAADGGCERRSLSEHFPSGTDRPASRPDRPAERASGPGRALSQAAANHLYGM